MKQTELEKKDMWPSVVEIDEGLSHFQIKLSYFFKCHMTFFFFF